MNGKAYNEELTSIYDLLTGSIDYHGWIDYFLQLAQIGGVSLERQNLCLDLACGTGGHSFPLLERNWRVLGIDISPQMIKRARQRAEALGFPREQISFDVKDIRKFSLDEPVDAAICFHDGLNYLLDEKDLEQVFIRVRKALKIGGCFCFDLNQLKVLGERFSSKQSEAEVIEEPDFTLIYQTSYEAARQIWEVQLSGFVLEHQSGAYRKFQESHRERHYEPDDVKKTLEKVGFQVLGLFHPFTLELWREESRRVFVLAKAK